MSSIDSAISNANLYQDIELATAINSLKSNGNQLQTFLQQQQDKVYKKIVNQKDNTFQKVYGDLNNAYNQHGSVIYYNKRSKDLSAMQDSVYERQKEEADAILEDKQLSSRKYEMNEWTIGNKQDTLFVFSSLFIMLSGLIIITVLWRMGIISSGLWAAIGAPLIIIFILIVLNRSEYTNNLRNMRFWNKKRFEGKYGKTPIPYCPQALSAPNSAAAANSAASQSPDPTVSQPANSAASQPAATAVANTK